MDDQSFGSFPISVIAEQKQDCGTGALFDKPSKNGKGKTQDTHSYTSVLNPITYTSVLNPTTHFYTSVLNPITYTSVLNPTTHSYTSVLNPTTHSYTSVLNPTTHSYTSVLNPTTHSYTSVLNPITEFGTCCCCSCYYGTPLTSATSTWRSPWCCSDQTPRPRWAARTAAGGWRSRMWSGGRRRWGSRWAGRRRSWSCCVVPAWHSGCCRALGCGSADRWALAAAPPTDLGHTHGSPVEATT